MKSRRFRRLSGAAFQPEATVWLGLFRLTTGLVLALEQVNSLIIGDWRSYLGPRLHLAYEPLPTLGVLPGWLPLTAWAGAIGGGLAVAAGWHYRRSATVLALSYWLLFLLDATEYVNHFYLYCLLATGLLLLPAHRVLSFDVVAGRAARLTHTPAWWRWMLQGQIGLVYFFGGIAKITPHWLEAAPLTGWLRAAAETSVLGQVLVQPWVAPLLAWGGLAFDLLIPFVLLNRRLRPVALGLVVGFHVTNALIFGLATFPWAMLALTFFLFLPPRTLLTGLAGIRRKLPLWQQTAARGRYRSAVFPPVAPPATPHWLAGLLVLYALSQLLLPLRHWLFPEYNVHWTEAGHRFAWHMMLRTKSGTLTFRVVDAGGRLTSLEPGAFFALSPRQLRKLAVHPDLLLQAAHAAGRAVPGTVAVYADSWVALNNHPARPLVAPNVNLLTQPRRLLHPHPWTTPSP